MPEVTRVVGNHEKMQAETWKGIAAPGLIGATERVQVDDIMSVRETAAVMRRSEGAVKMLISRAVADLRRRCLDEKGI